MRSTAAGLVTALIVALIAAVGGGMGRDCSLRVERLGIVDAI
jgi:hypothetical protein